MKKLLSGHIPHASEPDLRGFEWHHLWGRLAQSESVPALKHAAVLKCADISPDGTLIASGCADGSVHLWDRQHQSLIHSYAGHADQLKAILFLPESNLVVSGTLRETIVWNVVDSVQRATLSVTGHELAVSPDGRWLVTSYQKPSEIAVLEARSLSSGAQPQFVFSDHSDDVSGLAFVDDGQTLVSSSHDGTVKLWDLADGRLITTLTGHTDQIDSVACAPGIIASGGDDGNIILQQRCGLYLHAPESQVRRL